MRAAILHAVQNVLDKQSCLNLVFLDIYLVVS